MTGIADTKMFLSPGNLVETLFYQEFLKLCPMISSLSLHSFTGSLISLALPLSLSELILPWDNRLNLEKQRNEILVSLSAVPWLKSLAILRVEEVDVLLLESHTKYQQLPILEIAMESLETFHLKNACILSVDLTKCSYLSSFSIQCCPTLQQLSLPNNSLKQVCIYDEHLDYISKFFCDFVAARSQCNTTCFCHLHIQLHSVLKQEPNAEIEHQSKADDLFSTVGEICRASSAALDFLVLKDNSLHLFEHNSGEILFPFTEFHQEDFTSSRSEAEVRVEISCRKCILEGLDRWKGCVMDVKSRLCAVDSSLCAEFERIPQVLSFDTTYCDSAFKCATNIHFLKELNANAFLCQLSSSIHTTANRDTSKDGEIATLNVPHLQSSVKAPAILIDQSKIRSNPLIFVSIIEYAHNIYTLFYYD